MPELGRLERAIIARHNSAERDWPEDFALDNGLYENGCVSCTRTFLGYKRRSTCRECAHARLTQHLYPSKYEDPKALAELIASLNQLYQPHQLPA